MYKDSKYATFRDRVLDACKDGYISLVVGYPAKSKPAKAESETQKSYLSGYIRQIEAETLFGSELCSFLSFLRELQKSL